MSNVWKFLESGAIQGAIALGSVGAIIYLAVVSQPVPEALAAIAGAATGFYFGGITQAAIQRRS